jgi:hypothetical protein
MKFFLFSLFLSIFIINCKAECEEEYKNQKTNPRDCCDFPIVSTETLNKFDDVCKNGCDEENLCCPFDCFYENVTKIFDDGKYHKENFIELIFERRDELFRESWKEIVEKNIDKCEKLSELEIFKGDHLVESFPVKFLFILIFYKFKSFFEFLINF